MYPKKVKKAIVQKRMNERSRKAERSNKRLGPPGVVRELGFRSRRHGNDDRKRPSVIKPIIRNVHENNFEKAMVYRMPPAAIPHVTKPIASARFALKLALTNVRLETYSRPQPILTHTPCDRNI